MSRCLNEGKKVLSNDNLWPQWGVTQRNVRNFLLKFRVTALPSIFHSGFSREMVIRSFKVTSREQIREKKKICDRITAFILSSPLPICPFIDTYKSSVIKIFFILLLLFLTINILVADLNFNQISPLMILPNLKINWFDRIYFRVHVFLIIHESLSINLNT